MLNSACVHDLRQNCIFRLCADEFFAMLSIEANFQLLRKRKLVPAERRRLGTASIPKSSTLPSAQRRAVHFVNVARGQAILGCDAGGAPDAGRSSGGQNCPAPSLLRVSISAVVRNPTAVVGTAVSISAVIAAAVLVLGTVAVTVSTSASITGTHRIDFYEVSVVVDM